MAVNTAQEAFSSERRFAIGANVTVAIVAAALLLVAVNWISSIKYVRKDIAAYGSYGLSERTKTVVRDCKEPIQLSLLYQPKEDDDKQRTYISRLLDYCDELQRYSPNNVRVTHVANDSQREKLVASISQTFGGEAGKHKTAIESYYRLSNELTADLDKRIAQAQQLIDARAWLSDFPIFANIQSTFKSDREAIKKATREINELAPKTGIPKYSEATTKAKTSLNEVKGHLTTISTRLKDLASLVDETSKADSKYIAMLRDVAGQIKKLTGSLRAIVGTSETTSKNPAKELKAFADRGLEVNTALEGLVREIDEFAHRFPMVKQHANWGMAVQMGPIQTRMDVADVLEQTGQSLASSRLDILGIIDKGDPAQLNQALDGVRRKVSTLENNAGICEKLLTELSARLGAIDKESKAMLDSAKAGTLFADRIKAIDDLDKQITGLPELKLGSVADKLKEENVVVVEAKGKIRTVGFSEVWPVRESVGGPGANKDIERTFNGDSAISSAILALTRDKPFATVVLTGFEPPAPPQRNQFMPPPPQSWIPMAQLSELRKRLEAANFKVVDWNMATTKEAPKPEEGTKSVYVLLPPPPPQQQMFMNQQQPANNFGDPQREQIKKLLDQNASMLFMGTWEVRPGGMFGGPPMTPAYGYGTMLEKDWGIRIDNSKRLTWIEPDHRQPDLFAVVAYKLAHLPVGGFTDQAIGSPMRGTRFLITDGAPIYINKPPSSVSIQPILRVPQSENYIAATINQFITIFDEIQNPNNNGFVRLPALTYGPFDLMVAAERKEGDKNKGRIVVSGIGTCVRDGYLNAPVMSSGNTLRMEPAPAENADLFTNALYWLADQSQFISRGPVPVPRVRPMEPQEQKVVKAFVWGIWPVIVFSPCILLWFIRRR